MSQFYTNPKRESDPYALPDAEVFQLTANEAAEYDEDLIWEYLKRPAFRLATMNSQVREHMLNAIVEENGIKGGWFYWYCFTGCLPDSAPYGPYDTEQEAIDTARAEVAEPWIDASVECQGCYREPCTCLPDDAPCDPE